MLLRQQWFVYAGKFREVGIDNPYDLEPRAFTEHMLGWLLDGRPTESKYDDDGKLMQMGQNDLLDALGGNTEADSKQDAIDEMYRRQGMSMSGEGAMNEMQIGLRRELRGVTDPMQRAKITAKWHDRAKAARAELTGATGDGGRGHPSG